MTDFGTLWARRRVEAMADGSLPGRDRQRMRAEMARDPELRTAVERAAALRRELRGLARARVPSSLPWRLLGAVPGGAGRRSGGSEWLSWASAAVSAGFVAALLLVALPRPGSETPDERAAALRELQFAMVYLERSSTIAREEVERAVADGLRKAIDTSRDALGDREGNGG